MAYAIGVARAAVGAAWIPSAPARSRTTRLAELVRKYFDLTPAGIIKQLDLRRPIYQQTAAYGHFGRTDLNVTWEGTDMAETLKNAA